jgi:hypothetical protein
MAPVLNKTYDPQEFRPLNIVRFRGVTGSEGLAGIGTEYVSDSGNLLSDEIRSLRTRNGQLADSRKSGSVNSALSSASVRAFGIGGTVEVDRKPNLESVYSDITAIPFTPVAPSFDYPDSEDSFHWNPIVWVGESSGEGNLPSNGVSANPIYGSQSTAPTPPTPPTEPTQPIKPTNWKQPWAPLAPVTSTKSLTSAMYTGAQWQRLHASIPAQQRPRDENGILLSISEAIAILDLWGQGKAAATESTLNNGFWSTGGVSWNTSGVGGGLIGGSWTGWVRQLFTTTVTTSHTEGRPYAYIVLRMAYLSKPRLFGDISCGNSMAKIKLFRFRAEPGKPVSYDYKWRPGNPPGDWVNYVIRCSWYLQLSLAPLPSVESEAA